MNYTNKIQAMGCKDIAAIFTKEQLEAIAEALEKRQQDRDLLFLLEDYDYDLLATDDPKREQIAIYHNGVKALKKINRMIESLNGAV